MTDDAADYLASAFGLRRAPGSTPGTAVYVYHAVDCKNAEGNRQKAEDCKQLAATRRENTPACAASRRRASARFAERRGCTGKSACATIGTRQNRISFPADHR